MLSPRRRRLFALAMSVASLTAVAACSSSSSSSSSAISTSSGSAQSGTAASFCDAYGAFDSFDKSADPKTPAETEQVIAQQLALFATVEAAAPADVAQDVAAAGQQLKAGLAIITKYGNDIDAALSSATPDEHSTLAALGTAPGSGTPAANLLDYVRASCPNVDVPTEQSKFSSISSTIN